MAESQSRLPLAPASLGGNARNAAVNPNSDIKVKSLGAALQAGAEDMADAWQKDVVRRDRLEEVKQTAAYRARIAEEVDGLDPLADDYEARLDETITRSKEDFLGSTKFGTSQVRDEFSNKLDTLAIGDKAIAMNKRRGALSDDAIRVRQEGEDSAYAAIREDPDAYELHLVDFAENARKLNISIKPQLLPKMNEAFADQAVLARSEGFALAGRHDEAKAFLDANQGELDPDVFIGAKRRVREIEGQQRQDSLSATESQVADMEIRAVDAKDGATLTKLRAEVEGLNAQGFFKGQENKRVSLIRQIESQREQLVNKNKDLGIALARYASGEGVNSRAQADLVYDRLKSPDMTIAEEVELSANFASKSGVLPSRIHSLIRNAERTENPQALAEAAKALDRVSVVAPDVETGVREKDSRVELVSAMVRNTGVDYDQAADMALKRVPDAATLKERNENLKTLKRPDPRDMLPDHSGIFRSAPFMPAEVRRHAKETFETFYRTSGNADNAEAATKDRMAKVYGTTSVGGASSLTKHPPESFNPVPQAKREELAADFFPKFIDGELKAKIEASGNLPAPGPDDKDPWAVDKYGTPPFSLVPDARTGRDIEAGRRPTYQIHVRNRLGILSRQPTRYELPTAEQLHETPEYKALAAKKAKSMQGDRDLELRAAESAKPTPGGPGRKRTF